MDLLAAHRRLVRDAIARYDGLEHDAEGDAFFVLFREPGAALTAAIAIQRAIAAHQWPSVGTLRIRVGVHTGTATVVDGRYYGADVHQAARICAAAHGGQIVVSAAVASCIEADPPPGVRLHDLGEHLLRDFDEPERLYQAEIGGLPREFPPLRTPRVAAVRLPEQRTSFIGREGELGEARALLSRSRLLTLTGPGGTGKTRLAVELAVAAARDFPDGVTFVPLAPVADHALVVSSIAQALELTHDGRRPIVDILVEHLADKNALLLLDNFEHVNDAAPLVDQLLGAATGLRVVVTSRTPLRLSGEQQLAVAPLRAASAVQLFVERAREVSPGFALDESNAEHVAAACARLDSLPLAIELAAARINVLPIGAINARLDRSLALLVAGPRDQPDRLRSLHAAISWSYDLLPEPARQFFCRLSVFVGGAALDLVPAVCAEDPSADALDRIAELISHSLLQVETLADPRYTMLETIREYASEALCASGESDLIRDRHAAAFLELAESAAPGLVGLDCRILLDRFESEQHNLRAALLRFVGRSDASGAMRMVSALWRYWQMRGHLAEAQERIDHVFAMPGAAGVDRSLWLAALEGAGGIAYWRGDIARSEQIYRDALDASRKLGDMRWIAQSLCNLAYVLRGAGEADGAMAAAREALTRFTELGDTAGQASALRLIAILRAAAADLDGAEQAATRARTLFEGLDRPFDLAWTLRQVGMIQLKKGNPAAARHVLSDALRLFTTARDMSSAPVIMADLASCARAEGDAETADSLAGESRSLRAATGANWARIVDRLENRERATEDDAQA